MLHHKLALSYYSFKKKELKDILELTARAEDLFTCCHNELTSHPFSLSERAASRLLARREEFLLRAKEQEAKMRDFMIPILALGEPHYPPFLAECCDAPIVLYAMGDTEIDYSSSKLFTLTGTKSTTESGKVVHKKLIDDIYSFSPSTIIVTGLNDGVEKRTLHYALKKGLKCIVVSNKSLDKAMSGPLRDLLQEVLKNNGLVLSEYPIGTGYTPNSYDETNRVLAGFSHATILVEAPLNSNTLKTLAYAESYGREVFAFPGRATDYSYEGCNAAIKSGRAEMITCFSDVVCAMELIQGTNAIAERPKIEPAMSKDEKLIYDVLADGLAHSDEEILLKSGLSSQQFNVLVSLMELNDLIIPLKGRMYTIKP